MQRKEASNGLSILGPDSSFPLVPFRQPFFCFPSSFLVRAQGSGFIRMFTVAETTFFTFTERGLVSIILFERGQGRSTGATLSYYFVFSYFGFPPRVPASMHGSGLCSGRQRQRAFAIEESQIQCPNEIPKIDIHDYFFHTRRGT